MAHHPAANIALVDGLTGTDPVTHAALRRMLDLLSDGEAHRIAELVEASGLPAPRAVDLLDAGHTHRPRLWWRKSALGPDGLPEWRFLTASRPRSPETDSPTLGVDSGENDAQEGAEAAIRPIQVPPVGGEAPKPQFPAVRVKELRPNPHLPQSVQRRRRTRAEIRHAWATLSEIQTRRGAIFETGTSGEEIADRVALEED